MSLENLSKEELDHVKGLVRGYMKKGRSQEESIKMSLQQMVDENETELKSVESQIAAHETNLEA